MKFALVYQSSAREDAGASGSTADISRLAVALPCCALNAVNTSRAVVSSANGMAVIPSPTAATLSSTTHAVYPKSDGRKIKS